MKDIQDFIAKHQVVIQKNTSELIDEELTPMFLIMHDVVYEIQIMDEYQDLKYGNAFLDFILVFRELEQINDSVDYLDWCKQQGLQPNNDQLRNYFIAIVKVIPEISTRFPNNKITSYILDLDFQLNSGAIQSLRK